MTVQQLEKTYGHHSPDLYTVQYKIFKFFE